MDLPSGSPLPLASRGFGGLMATRLYILDPPIVNAKPLKFSMLYYISLNNAISANAEILSNSDINVMFSLFVVVSTYVETGHFSERDRTARCRSD